MPEVVDGAALVRFVFVLLGPAIVDLSYYEMGRSISTLIADKVMFLDFKQKIRI